MPKLERVSIDISDIRLVDTARRNFGMGALSGVNVLVLMRHRH